MIRKTEMKSPVPDHKGHWVAGATGLVVSLGFTQLTGMHVPWATYSYYWLGWPLMCAIVFLITRHYPYRAWRWPLSMAVGQVFGVILVGAGSMVPVALVYALLLSAPQFILASHISRKMLGSGPADEYLDKGDDASS